jgi:predicted NAD/FAD-dependent oxidoreductase
MQLSRTQAKAIEHLKLRAGHLHRWPCGFWTTEQMPPDNSKTVPDWYIGTPTVSALERIGAIRPVTPRPDWAKQHFELAPQST